MKTEKFISISFIDNNSRAFCDLMIRSISKYILILVIRSTMKFSIFRCHLFPRNSYPSIDVSVINLGHHVPTHFYHLFIHCIMWCSTHLHTNSHGFGCGRVPGPPLADSVNSISNFCSIQLNSRHNGRIYGKQFIPFVRPTRAIMRTWKQLPTCIHLVVNESNGKTHRTSIVRTIL